MRSSQPASSIQSGERRPTMAGREWAVGVASGRRRCARASDRGAAPTSQEMPGLVVANQHPIVQKSAVYGQVGGAHVARRDASMMDPFERGRVGRACRDYAISGIRRPRISRRGCHIWAACAAICASIPNIAVAHQGRCQPRAPRRVGHRPALFGRCQTNALYNGVESSPSFPAPSTCRLSSAPAAPL